MPDYPPREGEREKERVGAPALHHQLLADAWLAFRAAGLAWPASHAAGAWPAPGASPTWPAAGNGQATARTAEQEGERGNWGREREREERG